MSSTYFSLPVPLAEAESRESLPRAGGPMLWQEAGSGQRGVLQQPAGDQRCGLCPHLRSADFFYSDTSQQKHSKSVISILCYTKILSYILRITQIDKKNKDKKKRFFCSHLDYGCQVKNLPFNICSIGLSAEATQTKDRADLTVTP